MIEFHRLNGNKTMNFWRLSTQKKFTDFEVGELLFFLAKGSERKKEKGIIGYGRFAEHNMLSVRSMWNRYGTLNGYSSELELREAIKKVCKQDEIPQKLSCLYLKDVVFFQYPVYLSEFGVKISNKVESYIYLDKEDEHLTNKILQKAFETGVDLWSGVINDVSIDILEEEAVRHGVANAYSTLKEITLTPTERRRAQKLMKQYRAEHGFEVIQGSKLDSFRIDGHKITICIPLILNAKDAMVKLQMLAGRIQLYKSLLKPENYEITYEWVSDTPVSEELNRLLKGTVNE